MKIEKQVPSRKLCEKLKELGYPQEGIFWLGKDSDEIVFYRSAIDRSCVAPTVAEMGDRIKCDSYSWWDYRGWHAQAHGHKVHAETEADARAKMLIYLAENKLISF